MNGASERQGSVAQQKDSYTVCMAPKKASYRNTNSDSVEYATDWIKKVKGSLSSTAILLHQDGVVN